MHDDHAGFEHLIEHAHQKIAPFSVGVHAAERHAEDQGEDHQRQHLPVKSPHGGIDRVARDQLDERLAERLDSRGIGPDLVDKRRRPAAAACSSRPAPGCSRLTSVTPMTTDAALMITVKPSVRAATPDRPWPCPSS